MLDRGFKERSNLKIKKALREAILKNTLIDRRVSHRSSMAPSIEEKNLVVIDGFISNDELHMIQQFMAYNEASQA